MFCIFVSAKQISIHQVSKSRISGRRFQAPPHIHSFCKPYNILQTFCKAQEKCRTFSPSSLVLARVSGQNAWQGLNEASALVDRENPMGLTVKRNICEFSGLYQKLSELVAGIHIKSILLLRLLAILGKYPRRWGQWGMRVSCRLGNLQTLIENFFRILTENKQLRVCSENFQVLALTREERLRTCRDREQGSLSGIIANWLINTSFTTEKLNIFILEIKIFTHFIHKKVFNELTKTFIIYKVRLIISAQLSSIIIFWLRQELRVSVCVSVCLSVRHQVL